MCEIENFYFVGWRMASFIQDKWRVEDVTIIAAASACYTSDTQTEVYYCLVPQLSFAIYNFSDI